MTAYYNENDPNAAAWLRELIQRNLIAPGVVDDRSIVDVEPSDIAGFSQCHFFAGIGVWSYALRCAGWRDDRAVWTASLPCQPFSAAGRGEGVADERHLWPEFFRLARVARPDVVFGEQVASPAGLAWFDIVSVDLEGAGYAVGAADVCAAGVGAPHIRQRLWWVADADDAGLQRRRLLSAVGVGSSGSECVAGKGGVARGLAYDARNGRREECADAGGSAGGNCTEGRSAGLGGGGAAVRGWVADADDQRKGLESGRGASVRERRTEHDAQSGFGWSGTDGGTNAPDGFWDTVDWLGCRDGRWRPVEPGTSPLAHGAPTRVVRLRGYGNAIVAPLAQAWIEAYRDVTETTP